MSSRVKEVNRCQTNRRNLAEDTAGTLGRYKYKKHRRAKTQQTNVRASIELIKKTTSEKAAKIDVKTMVNEQELFGALMHKKLAAQDPELGAKFQPYFKHSLGQVQDMAKTEPVFRAARRTLRRLVKTDGLVKPEFAARIRRFAAGKAQLDDRKKSMLAEKLNEADKAPSKTIAEALSLVTINSRFDSEEHAAFKSNMNDLICGKLKWDATRACETADLRKEKKVRGHVCDKPSYTHVENAEAIVCEHDCAKGSDSLKLEFSCKSETGESSGLIDSSSLELSIQSPTDIDANNKGHGAADDRSSNQVRAGPDREKC